MIYFPTICVDDFFPNPDHIRNYALTADNLEWGPAEGGKWPGIRTCPLHEVNYNLFQEIATRYFLLHYSPSQISEVTFEARMNFQRISGKYNGGWVHNDYPNVHTTLIYLTPTASLNSGTGLYKIKSLDGLKNFDKSKKDLYNNKVSSKEVEKDRIENNNQFEKTVYFSNIYNRCISFDATIWHGADEFVSEEDRLTLIIFWEKINGPMTNLQNSKSFPLGVV